MAKYVYIIPGILTELDSVRTWDFKAQAFFAKHGYIAVGLHYSAGVIGGAVWRSQLATEVGHDLSLAQSAGLDICIIAHSNGCNIACETLRQFPNLKNVNLYLLAPANDKDCRANGLNAAAEAGQIKSIVIFASPHDEILALTPLEPGYGELGRVGPTRMSDELANVATIEWRGCSHGDWVGKDFVNTMEVIESHLGANQ